MFNFLLTDRMGNHDTLASKKLFAFFSLIRGVGARIPGILFRIASAIAWWRRRVRIGHVVYLAFG